MFGLELALLFCTRRGPGGARDGAEGAGAVLGDDVTDQPSEEGEARQSDVGQTLQHPALHELH